MQRTMNGKNKFFVLSLLAILALAFTAHVYIHSSYEYPLFGSYIIASYLFNLAYVSLEVWFLGIRQKKKGANLGNAYLALSMFKFLVFFAVFIPIFKLDGATDRFEFFGFFVPYAICLVAGTIFFIKILNQSDSAMK